MNRKSTGYWLFCGLIGAVLALPKGAQAQTAVPASWTNALQFAAQQLQATAAAIPLNEAPEATGSNGAWSTIVADTNLPGWTQGFLPGSLWYLYEQTGDAQWQSLAAARLTPLTVQETNTTTQDLGFKMFPSFGHGYELAGDATDKQVALTAAASLATRFYANPGIISMGTWNPAWKLPLTIDAMMDIELLIWASRNGGDPSWEQMAISHAEIALRDLVRADGSTYQVANYDPTSGQLLWQGTYQGYSNTSDWARGQTWAMYGFARMYRYTQLPEFLTAARETTAFYLSHLPADGVPPWDFNSPDPEKDSSAAAVGAAALLELADVETDATSAASDRAEAQTIINTLAGPDYLAQGTDSAGVLLHGVGNYTTGQEVDVSLSYGDYYFIEAILRAQAQLEGQELATIAVPPGTQAVATGSSPDAGSSGTPPSTGSPSGTTSTTTPSASPTPTAAVTTRDTGGCSALGFSGAWGLLGVLIAWRRTRQRIRRRSLA